MRLLRIIPEYRADQLMLLTDVGQVITRRVLKP